MSFPRFVWVLFVGFVFGHPVFCAFICSSTVVSLYEGGRWNCGRSKGCPTVPRVSFRLTLQKKSLGVERPFNISLGLCTLKHTRDERMADGGLKELTFLCTLNLHGGMRARE